MERTVSVERLYPLGDYKNIKLIDTVSNIPEELFLDKTFMSKLKILQIIDMEILHKKYLRLNETLHTAQSYEDAMTMLEELRSTTFADLQKALTGEK